MKPYETFTHHGLTVEIHQDTDVESPTEFGDAGLFLVSGHRDFYVPEPGEKRIHDDWETIVERYKKTHWIFPIEAYIHSGVVLAFSQRGNFPDRQWDVSQIGGIFASKKEWRLSASARKAAEGLLNTWNQYLSGDVWGYVVGDDTPFEESCWGFFGLDYCREQAKEIAELVARKLQAEKNEEKRCARADIVTI